MVMPNFLIIGAGKSGTTSLYQYLQQHPNIYMSPHKEPRFFAFEGESINFQGPGDLTRTKFFTDIETYCTLFQGVSNEAAIGEASVCYLHIPKASERIQHYLPNVKLIVILRNPVERAYSNFLQLVRAGLEPISDFAQAMSAEEERIRNNWSYRWHYRQKGFYYVHLKRYFDKFDSGQIKIYLYEDFNADSISIVQDIFQFLEVEDTFIPNTSQKHNVSGIPKNKTLDKLIRYSNGTKNILKPLLPSKQLRQRIKTSLISLNFGKKPQLQPEVRRQFIEDYREDILRLQDLIQRDLSHWLKA